MITSYTKYTTLPNMITLSRVFLIPFFLVFSYKGLTSDFPAIYFAINIALLVFVLIRVTDFLDGWIARLTNSVTPLGSYLDVWTDFLFVLCSYIMLNFLNIIPFWLTALAIYKFFEFLILSEIIKKHLAICGAKSDVVLYYDIPGRIASTFFYSLPCLILVFNLLLIDIGTFSILYYGLLLITVFSSAIKFFNVKHMINKENNCHEMPNDTSCKEIL